MSTVLDIVSDALTEIAVIGEGGIPDAGQGQQALRRLNQMLNTWAADNLTINALTRTTATITASQASYTVGTGGNINITRPDFIDHVNFQDTSPTYPTEYQLGNLLTEAAYQGIVLKTLTSPFPQVAYYSPTYPLGTLYPWPIPTGTTLQWVVYHWAAVAQFASLATTVSLPPAYEEALATNLALLLCPAYEKQPHPVLIKRATDTLATLKRANGRLRDLSFDGALIGNSRPLMSIYTGP